MAESDKVNDRIENWKRKLVDLTRRNKLLFFTTPLRSSSLKIIQPSPIEIFRRLVVEEKSWKFFMPPEENEEQVRSAPAPPLLPTTTVKKDQSDPELLRKPDELLCQTREAQKLRTVLRNLYRRTESDFAERGVRILHVTFGILEWKETPQSELIRSPLLLVPIQLLRASINDPFVLVGTEADLVVNPALKSRLQSNFHLDLPPLPEDWEELDLNGYLAKIEQQVQSRGWSVLRECWIGLFSFHKLVMYEDLNSPTDLISQNPIVRALASEIQISNFNNGILSDPKDLDKLNPKESYLVVDADSSQLACIEAIKQGASLILQGPPGTGKSQTITNLIAESIAAGRTVLFVSEKMAALRVVYDRLLKANLGHYCLELHSHKADRRTIINELYKCYHESLQPRTVMTELEFQQLVDSRHQLNNYVNALHIIREPLGKSAYEVLGELAELERVQFIAPGNRKPESLTLVRLDKAVQLARRLGRVWRIVVEGKDFPWRGCTVSSYGPETRLTFQAQLDTCKDALTKLIDEG